MAVDLHTAQIQGFFDGPVDHLFALPILAGYLQSKLNVANVTVVAPDAGRVRVCERWTDRLGTPLAIIHKRRDPDVANQVKVFEVVGHVKGRTCILVDDMIDTGGATGEAFVVRLPLRERGGVFAAGLAPRAGGGAFVVRLAAGHRGVRGVVPGEICLSARPIRWRFLPSDAQTGPVPPFPGLAGRGF